ncbi:MAG: PadR family transcriptional regulator [Defluviitaleaceae bacterium]|nr:PadR family transcriptional regulator [Defluviitaleaceae bacterium]
MAIQATGILLEGCVLSLLSEEDAYAYNLTQQVKDALQVSESTLYPVMRRLQNAGCLTTYDIPHSGRNRRYYQITEKGHGRLLECTGKWRDFVQRINGFLVKKPE